MYSYNLCSLIQDVREKGSNIFENSLFCYYGYDLYSISHLFFFEIVIMIPILQMEKSRLSQLEQPFTLFNKRYNWDFTITWQACKLVLFQLPHF